MDRRNFLTAGAATGLAAGLTTGVAALAAAKAAPMPKQAKSGKFKLKYAPNLSLFNAHAGKDLIDHVKFMSEQGFRAVFDNGFPRKDEATQKAIARELERQDMELGPFVLYGIKKELTFVKKPNEDYLELNKSSGKFEKTGATVREFLTKTVKDGLEVAKRGNCKWMLMVPGPYNMRLEWAYQTANVVDNLKILAEVLEPTGIGVVLEPLNAWTNHPGLFLTKIPQSYQVCKAVGSPSIKIVNDLYHQQITEGNLIPNIEMAYSEIAAFHLGDNPGRKEPGTGEINYRNIFKYLHNEKKFEGVLCAEHGLSKGNNLEGEKAYLEAYRAADDFEVK